MEAQAYPDVSLQLAKTDDPLPTVSKQIRPPRMAQGLRVSVMAGSDAGARSASSQSKLFVGRSPKAELRLTDPTASVFHVELAVDGDGIVVRDLESLNGTYYQGARIRDATVPSGATLQVGSSLVRVERVTDPESTYAALLESLGETAFGKWKM